MTQSFNLSQLANNLDSSGRLDASDGLVNAVPIANGGTGATTASSARTNLDVAQAIYAVPTGGIIMWSGSIASIPTGWLLCDGSSGTPDLRTRFVIGAGSTYGVNGTGGSADAVVVSHTHIATVTDGGHSHTIVGGINLSQNDGLQYVVGNAGTVTSSSSAVTGITVANASTGVSGTNANLPPYYALAFIMKS
jgi:hypothetical protein